MLSQLDQLKARSTLKNSYYWLSEKDKKLFPGYNCFVAIGERIFLNSLSPNTRGSIPAHAYFYNIEKRIGCKLPGLTDAIENHYTEDLYGNRTEDSNNIDIQRHQFDKGNPQSDIIILQQLEAQRRQNASQQEQTSIPFILRDSSSVPGAKTIAYINPNTGNVEQLRFVVTENGNINGEIAMIHSGKQPNTYDSTELEQLIAAQQPTAGTPYEDFSSLTHTENVHEALDLEKLTPVQQPAASTPYEDFSSIHATNVAEAEPTHEIVRFDDDRIERARASTNHPVNIKVDHINFAPTKVDLADLNENGKLLSDERINRMKALFQAHPYISRLAAKEAQGHIADAKPERWYSVVKLQDPHTKEDRLYAIYKSGRKEDGERTRILGEGGFGRVKYMQDLETGKWYPIKLQTKSFDSAAVELNNLEIVQQARGGFERTGRKPQFIIGMEMAPGMDLIHFTTERQMPMARWLQASVDASESIQAVHNKGLWHCDIKTDNIMIDPVTGKVTVIDYGLAIRKGFPVERLAGTPAYFAPEIPKIRSYNEKTEVYALGKTLAEFLGFTKEGADRNGRLTLEIVNPRTNLNQKCHISDPILQQELYQLFTQMTATDPAARPTLTEAITKLKSLQAECLDVLGNIRKVGILNISEFQNNPAKRAEMIAALKLMDEVCFVDPGKRYTEHYDTIRRELEKHGVLVSDELYYDKPNTPAFDIIKTIPATSNQQHPEQIRSYFYVSTAENIPKPQLEKNKQQFAAANVHLFQVAANKEPKQYITEVLAQLPCTIREVDIIEKALTKDLERIQDKIKRLKDSSAEKAQILIDREAAIKHALNEIKVLQNRGQLTHGALEQKLTSLEKNILSTNKLHRKLADLGIIENRSTSAKVIKKINKEINSAVQRELGEDLQQKSTRRPK